ncbi:AraC family transcriptional regulator [Mesonia phycicola]|uniref:AraC family transcriptional regulator n=1 Tax=Mesonia phycicola TaxID=579105 RepID=A0A1M6CSK6_9FLAO|nr:GyrI-like domain-containing protein [Mesonia phycicola]SHI64002.1 AraC family transcriptional regulator [Mesonia phycicola]
MQVEIVNIESKLLAGLKTKMSFSNNKTEELWSALMPKKHLVKAKNNDLFSVEIYRDVSFFKAFDPTKIFEKWAAVEIDSAENIPNDFEALQISKGLYAKFNYKGKASEAAAFYGKIFGGWLPNSDFVLANRPHFAVMGEKYKGDSEDSEEVIYIPIEKKS